MHVGPAACLSPLRLQVKTGTSVVLQACTFNVCTIILTEKGLLLSNHWKTLEKSKEREALRQAGMGSFSQEEALGFLFDLISRVLIILLPIVTGFFLLDLCEGRCALLSWACGVFQVGSSRPPAIPREVLVEMPASLRKSISHSMKREISVGAQGDILTSKEY